MRSRVQHAGRGDVLMRDWHVHTTISDGSCTVGEVLAQAVHQGIASVAVTNHDTTAGLTAAVEAGRAFGVEVVGGIEISAWDATRNAKVHVLGLGLSEDSPAVNALCAPTLAARDANSRWQLDRLLEAGFAVDVERALELAAASTALYKQHLMAALTDAPLRQRRVPGALPAAVQRRRHLRPRYRLRGRPRCGGSHRGGRRAGGAGPSRSAEQLRDRARAGDLRLVGHRARSPRSWAF